jgi:hypothetical protein
VIRKRFVELSVLILLVWLVPVFTRAQATTATVSISSYPSSVVVGQDFSVTVKYSAPQLDRNGPRARLFLEIRDAAGGSVIERMWNDNSGEGHEEPSGNAVFTTSIGAGHDQIYFVAYLSPMEFNQWFIKEYESYPTDGTYPYKWEGNGVTHDIYYQDELILANNSGNYCYCSGITYEVFMGGYSAYNAAKGQKTIGGLTVDDMKKFRQDWYGVGGNKQCAVNALTKWGLAYRITDREKVHQGDDVQLWRWSGSGHSVIFVNWVRDANQQITGMRYWSSQKATNGTGYRTEYFGEEKGLKAEECYYARKIKPVDDDDWPNRYTDASTVSRPTIVRSGAPAPTPTPVPVLPQ